MTIHDISRRRALTALVGGGASLAVGCSGNVTEGTGGESAAGTGGTGGTGGSGAGGDGGTCAVTPEGEIGPYFADDSASGFNRSNIVANIDGTEEQTGIPLTLTITVLDGEKSCAAYEGAQIDIWHCNPAGVYSDQASEGTSTKSWLRGYQITDANGQVTFTTVIPGWYSGRTTHIHLRVRSSYSEASSTSDGTNTTQVFFSQSLVDSLATTVSPYDSEGTNPTTNASDRVYAQQTLGKMQMTLSGDNTSGYAAKVTIVLPITDEDDAGTSTASTTSTSGGGMGAPGG